MAPSELILHHYDFSNYSEKVRLVLGLKGLGWRSVDIPAYAPKPDYTPLTAGYRRTPALQIGADVYCDTQLIADRLESLAPVPSIYPDDNPAGRTQLDALVYWAEHSVCRPLALYITGVHAARFTAAFHADRARLHGKPCPSEAQVRASAQKYLPQIGPQLEKIESLFADGRTWVLGPTPTLADFALYEAPWFLQTIGGKEALPSGLPRLRAWMARVAAIGHGVMEAFDPAAALDVARSAEPATLPDDSAGDFSPEGLEPGDRVRVMPLDNQDTPASGELVAIDQQRIVLATDGPRTGRVHVHFPRLGYRCGRLRS